MTTHTTRYSLIPRLKLPLLLLVLVVLCGLPASRVSAQSLKDMVDQEISRTRQMIDRAEDAIRSLNDDRLEQAVSHARDIQKEAEDAFHQERYIVARALTLQARQLIKQLSALARPSEQQDGSLQGRLDRAEGMMGDASELADNSQLKSLYDNARSNLDRAWEYFRNGESKPAAKLLEQVERALEQILGRGRMLDQGREHFMRRIDAIRALIDDALALTSTCSNSAARLKAEQADQQFERAREHHEQGRPLLALRALQSARDLATSAINDCDNGVELDQLLMRIEQQRDRVLERIGGRTDEAADAAKRLIAQTNVHLDDARLALSQKKRDAAAVNLKAAQLTLRQAERHLGHP